jgi:hypothetical protein
MGPEYAIGQVVQLLVVWGPVTVLFIAIVRLLWRAGDRQPNRDLLAGQQQLQTQIDALTREIRDLKGQLRGTERVGS